ncbi:hypothetical protein EMCRGX_G006409 [Ephydatia muelleri]
MSSSLLLFTSQLDDSVEDDGPKPGSTAMDCTGTSGGLSLSFRDESMRMERLLGSICQPLHHSSPTRSSRGTPNPTPRGTPCLMDTARNKLQTRMADVKKYMIDIAHASHHLDHLAKTVETNRLPKGLTVEPRMMLIDADEETAAEWKEQTRRNTLGYIDVAKRHYTKQIARKTEAITDCQRKALESISDFLLTDKQRRALKGSYEELLKHAEKEAKAIKRERDQSSQSKLEEGKRPPKRPKTSQQRPICSCVNSVTSNISRFLDHWLKQAVRLLPSYISDSTHFIKTIEDITFAKDILLGSIDVTNMYTNIPIDEGNRAAIRALENLKCQTDMPNMAALTELLDLITKNNVFEFDGEFYIQTKGVPMGNIMAPSYSGIFMGELETRLIDLQSDKIKLWVRYIDDIFVAWQGTQTDFDNFVQQCKKTAHLHQIY